MFLIIQAFLAPCLITLGPGIVLDALFFPNNHTVDVALYAISTVSTLTQKMKGMNIYTQLVNDYGGASKANQTAYKVIPPVEKLIMPLYNQVHSLSQRRLKSGPIT